MGILDRLGMIVRSNVNSVLDKSSNPEADLNLFMLEMQDGIKQAETGVQNSVVQEKMMAMNATDKRRQAQEWDAKAQVAVKANRDDLATEALRQKMNYDQEAESLEKQAQDQQAMTNQLRSQLEELKKKYAETEQNKSSLIARYNMNKYSEKVMGTREPGQALPNSDYNRMQQKIMAAEVRAEMDDQNYKAAAAEAELNKLQADATLEDELASLKQRMGGSKPKAEEPKSATNPADRPYEEK